MSEQLVDERIVAMKFDNSQFEKNVGTSINTLDKLKGSLKLEGAARSLESINTTAEKMNFGGLSGAVDTVKERFSALEVIGVTALANITNSAVNAGKRILHSLTIEPVKEGFSEYELKMGSVQTIMASTGESLETVNSYLDELNTYADKTIYSFSDMTSSIGKFTNAGVNLKDAVKAIQGISNEAAVSGANAQQASHAMYNFAQALSSGSVKLIDWKSIETANMATVEFKNELIKTALELGTLKKQGDKYVSTTTDMSNHISDSFDATVNFNDSLKAQWMTSEVLIKTLGKYSDETSTLGKKAFAAAQDVKTFSQLLNTLKEAAGSGWANTWEIVFGDFEESKKLWTGLSNVVGGFIDRTSNARNTLLKTWKEYGGQKAVIDAFKNTFEALKNVIEPLRYALKLFIPPITVETLMRFSVGLKNLTERFKMSEETSQNLRNTFKGLASVIGILKSLFSAVYRSIKPLMDSMGEKGLISKILSVTGAFGRWLYNVNKFIIRNDVFYKGIQIGIGYIKKFIDTIKHGIEVIRKGLHLPEAEEIKKNIIGFFDIINSKISEFGKFSSERIKGLCNRISEAFKKDIPTPGLDNVNKKLDKTEGIFSRIHIALESFKNKITGTVKSIFDRLKNSKIGQFFSALLGAIKRIASAIASLLGKAFNGLIVSLKKADFDSLLNIIKAISTGAIAVSIKKFFETLSNGVNSIKAPFDALNGLKGIVGGVTSVLKGVQGCLEAYQQKLKSGVLLRIAIAIGILAASILVLSCIKPEKLDAAVGAITMMFIELMGSMATFTKISGSKNNTKKLTTALLAMSAAILIVSMALKKVGALSSDEAERGVVGIAAIAGILIGFIKILDSGKDKNDLSKGADKLIEYAAAMIVFGMAIKKLASVCKTLAKLSWDELIKGLAGVGALLLEVSLFLKKTDFDKKKIISASFGLILIGTAVKILASACKTLAGLDWEGLAKGLIGIYAILRELSVFISDLDSKKIFSSSVALIAIGVAMKILASACKTLAGLDWEGLAKGLIGFYAIMGELSVFVSSLDGKKIFASSVALIAIGAAMKIIVSACKSLAKLDWEGLAKGLGGMSVILLEIYGLITKIDDKKIFASSAALIAIGIAMKILASACKTLAQLDWEGLIKGLVGIGVLLYELSLFTNALPDQNDILKAGAALIAMGVGLRIFASVCKVFSKMSVKELVIALAALAGVFVVIGVAGKVLGPMALELLAFSNAMLVLGAAFAVIGAGLLFVGLGFGAVIASIIALAKAIAVGYSAIKTAFSMVIQQLCSMIPIIIKKLGEGIIEFIKVIKSSIPEIAATIKEIVLALVDILNECAPTLIETFFSLIVSVLNAAVTYVPTIVDRVFDLIIAVLHGVAERLPELIGAVFEVIQALFTGVFEAFNNMGTEGLAAVLSGVGIIAEILAALAALGVLAVPAMAGVLAMGALVLELSGVLAALGAIEHIPGLNWIIGEGGKLLGVLGEAIGSFVGGLLGSAMDGVASKLPGIGENLSDFFEKAKPFIDGAGKLTASSMDGIKALIDVLLMLTGANVLESLTAWLTGGSSLSKFGEELAAFGPSMSSYYNSIKDIKSNVVTASANAASALAQMAKKLPKHGGFLEWITGSTTLTTFTRELLSFGPAMKSYYFSIKDIKSDVVTVSANAASSLAEMASKLPKHGGFLEWITGSATLTTFARELLSFGPAMQSYAHSVEGINAKAVEASANAALMLTKVNNNLPETGGLRGFINGDKSLVNFANGVSELGPAIGKIAEGTQDIEPEKLSVSVTVLKKLSEINQNLPEEGGLKQVFTGSKSLGNWVQNLDSVGIKIKQYAANVKSIETDGLGISITALSRLADINEKLEPDGGFKQVFTGSKSLGNWVQNLDSVGTKIKQYAANVKGINTSGLFVSVIAIKALAAANHWIPEKGGLKDIWDGKRDFGAWAKSMGTIGEDIKKYADNVSGIKTKGLLPSVLAIKTLAAANGEIPSQGGFNKIFTGEQSLGTFGTQLAELGIHLMGFCNSMEGVSAEKMTTASDVILALAKSAQALVGAADEHEFEVFSNSVPKMADGIKLLYAHLLNAGLLSSTKDFKKAIDIVMELVKIGIELNKMDYKKVYENFGESLGKMASEGLDTFKDTFVDSEKFIRRVVSENFLKPFTEAVEDSSKSPAGIVYLMMKQLAGYIAGKLTDMEAEWITSGNDMTVNLSSGLYDGYNKKLSRTLLNILTMMLTDVQKNEYRFRSIGSDIMTELKNGITSKETEIKSKGETIITWIIIPVKGSYDKFKQTGTYLVEGFAKGISESKAKAEAAARSMANAASNAAARALKEHSPSRVGYRIGDYFGVGFVNAINDSIPASYSAGTSIADSARRGLSKAVEKINSYVDDNIDSSPTIKPVLDLSELRKKAEDIDSMLSASQSITLADSSSAAFNSSHSVKRDIKVDNTDVVKEINALKGEVASLNGVISNLRVVMDTGALVGSIASPMNAALGRMAIYERRGS